VFGEGQRGDGQGTVDGDSFLPSLHLFSGSEYLSSITAWSLFRCSGLSRPRHSVITTYGRGIGGEAVEKCRVQHWGTGGIGALGARSDIQIYYISVASIESVRGVAS